MKTAFKTNSIEHLQCLQCTCSAENDEHACAKLPIDDDAGEPLTGSVDRAAPVTWFSHFRRVDGPWSWLVCMFLLTSSLIACGSSFSYGILFPFIVQEFQEGNAITAIPGAIALANSIMLGPVGGKLCDRYGCRVTMIAGGLLCAVGLLVSCFAPNVTILFLSFGMIFGFGVNLVYLSSLLILPRYFDKKRFLVTAMVSVGPGAGLLVMSPVVQALFSFQGWRKTFMSMAGIALLPFLGGWLLADSKRMLRDKSVTARRGCRTPACCVLFKDPMFVLCTAMVSVTCFGHAMPPVHLAKHCSDLAISSDRASWLYFSIGLSSLVSRLLCGKLGEAAWVPLPRIFQFGAFVLAISNLLLPLATKYEFLVLYSIGYGAGEGFVYTPIHCFVLDYLPTELRGQGFGVYQFFSGVSFAVAPSISGLLADHSGSYNPAFYTAGALELVGASLPFMIRFISKPDTGKEAIPLSMDSAIIVIEKETVL